MSDTPSAPAGTPYERAAAALARAPRRPRLVCILPEYTLFRGEVDASGLVDVFDEAAAVVSALHAATDVALALIARTADVDAVRAGLDRAAVGHVFAATRFLPPPSRLPSRAAAAAALATALRDIRGATGVALADTLLLDDGSLAAADVAALGVTLHQVDDEGLRAADLAAALDAFAANVDAARGF